MEYRVFSRKDLEHFDGTNGAPAYIAFRGQAYDVSKSIRWPGGRQQILHDAGRDLTDGLADAPHGRDVLAKIPRMIG
jgi:predicted heme/steroid binding protein